jgi:hypothetical protein
MRAMVVLLLLWPTTATTTTVSSPYYTAATTTTHSPLFSNLSEQSDSFFQLDPKQQTLLVPGKTSAGESHTKTHKDPAAPVSTAPFSLSLSPSPSLYQPAPLSSTAADPLPGALSSSSSPNISPSPNVSPKKKAYIVRSSEPHYRIHSGFESRQQK